MGRLSRGQDRAGGRNAARGENMDAESKWYGTRRKHSDERARSKRLEGRHVVSCHAPVACEGFSRKVEGEEDSCSMQACILRKGQSPPGWLLPPRHGDASSGDFIKIGVGRVV